VKKGLVTKSTGSWYTVKSENQVYKCKVKGNLRLKGIKNTNPVAVGDIVHFAIQPDEEVGIIHEIEERQNYIIRKSTNLSKQQHIIAANVDQTILMVTAAYPETPNEFIDRYLVTAEAYHIPCILVFNKIDLAKGKIKEKMDEKFSIYGNIGYPIIKSSVVQNHNLDEIKKALQHKTTVLSGYSGVGKSTLVNALQPGLDLKTADLSDYHLQGKHTTAFAEMFDLDFGGSIIDTPGIRAFGIVDFNKEEITYFFPEIFRTSKNCKFYNCTHLEEPGCAVKKAVQNDEISQSRYKSYVNLYTDEGGKYR
jgi:ribosome biogenesis GTPase